MVAVTRGIFELACGRDAVLCDLSALIADPGSIAQRLHFDTRWSDAGSDAGRDDFMENDEFSADSNFVAGEEFVEDGELDTQLETSKQCADCRIAGQKRLVTAFVALQDVTEAMGPTFIAPGTANQASHNTLLAANGEGEIVEVLDSLMPGGVHMTIAKGTCVLMDSRAFHLGGANISAQRRVLLDFAFMNAKCVPSTYCECINAELSGKYRLDHF